MVNTDEGTITGGDLRNATVTNQGGTITGGKFERFDLEYVEGVGVILTTRYVASFEVADDLAPMSLDAIDKIVIGSGITFKAEGEAWTCPSTFTA